MSRLVGRYAPSPTGDLHLGNLRTALLAWLFARSAGGGFLVRIEDLDEGRVREPFVASQLADLAAIGIDWDGEPVRQSERTDLYAEALGRLEDDGWTYPCFCSRREVREAASAQHGEALEGLYPGTCRELSEAEARRRIEAGESYALRLDAAGVRRRGGVPIETPEGGTAYGPPFTTIVDRLHGKRDDSVDDVVLRRRDGAFAYNLAVAVDDGEQGVTEVVRGDDLLPSTAAQARLCDLLGIERPAWAHVPLVLGPDSQRLAKRHGAVTLVDLEAERGWSAADAVRWMAESLGLAEPGEPVSASGLLASFDPDRLPSAPTTLDP